ncbi:site-specific integrase [Paenibacillus sp. FSL W7-1287]|uniref:site-specific integrase n=1 Tax=Paenibacillus sp. FSL W7-1287 TaxID=2954538 RepID=UPI0030F70B20
MSKPLDILIDTYTLSLRNRNLSELTISSYTSTLSRFISFLEDKKYVTSIGDVTKDHIEMYLAQLKHPATIKKNGVIVKNEKANEPLEATTRATVIAALRSFFKWAHAHSYITTNPAALIINPRTARKNVKTVSEKNVKKLFSKAEQSKFPSRDRFIFTLMLSTGPRVQEVAKLKIAHVNKEERKIFISGKGNKERELYISDALLEDLNEYLSDREKILKEHGKLDEESLLISQKGARPLSKRGLQGT